MSAAPRVTAGRVVRICLLLAGGLLVVGAVSLSIGAVSVPFSSVVRSLWESLTLSASSISAEHRLILFDIRLPRILLGMIVGAALALAGAGYQALLRNPLADPYVLGVSSGAALAAILSLTYAGRFPVATPVAALVGALLTIAGVYVLGRAGDPFSPYTLLLAGIVTASFLSALVMFIASTLPAGSLRGALFWLWGDLSNRPPVSLWWLAAVVIAVGTALYYVAGDLNLLLMGDPEAETLGVDVKRTKIIVYVVSSLATGVAVSVSGTIGFVGLLVPHLVRLLFGSDYRLLIPATALGGAIVLSLADTLARTVVAPSELQVGAVTAIVGAPVFIYLLRRPRLGAAALARTAAAPDAEAASPDKET